MAGDDNILTNAPQKVTLRDTLKAVPNFDGKTLNLANSWSVALKPKL